MHTTQIRVKKVFPRKTKLKLQWWCDAMRVHVLVLYVPDSIYSKTTANGSYSKSMDRVDQIYGSNMFSWFISNSLETK